MNIPHLWICLNLGILSPSYSLKSLMFFNEAYNFPSEDHAYLLSALSLGRLVILLLLEVIPFLKIYSLNESCWFMEMMLTFVY